MAVVPGALLFGGELYVDRIVNGTYQGEEGPFDGATFAIQPNSETKDATSKSHNNYGGIKESVTLPKPADFSITFQDGDARTLAIGLTGSTSALNQAAAAAADYPFTAKKGKWVSIGKARLTGPLTVKNGGTTYVLGTDYLVDAETGRIQALPAGTIPDNQACLCNTAVGVLTGTLIEGGTIPDYRARFRLVGKNLVNNAPVVVIVDEGIVSPSAAIDFLNGDFMTVPLKGRMKKQVGQPSAFRVEMRDPI